MRLAIIDTETTGTDPTNDHLLEVAIGIYSVGAERSLTSGLILSASWLVGGAPDDAVLESSKVHGIHPRMLDGAPSREESNRRVERMLASVDAVASHTMFDRDWMPDTVKGKPWVDTCNDFEWPVWSSSRSLIALAVAHGVGVVSAHRALDDVMTLVRMFDRIDRQWMSLEVALKRALRPKVRIVGMQSRDENVLAKEHGFRWDGEAREWWRTVASEDADAFVAGLPFKAEVMTQ
jgi:DNA polymerase-3 subunit epsilon